MRGGAVNKQGLVDRLKLAAVFSAVSFLVGAAAAAPEAGLREIRDPHYGEVVFNFFQQKYFAAITHLTAAQHFRRLKFHDDEAELLLGGLYLSYGLHREAGQIFARLIEQGARPAVRDRAWFYVAKIRYQRGYLDEALDAMGRIGGTLPGSLQPERQVLHAYLLMAKQRYGDAVEVLKGLETDTSWAPYGRYNLGIALIKAGETRAGVALLEKVATDDAKTEELKALRDKANVALGFAAIQRSDPGQAQRYLEQVRLRGLMSSKALLGMGWAQAEAEDHRRALVTWLELRNRDVMDSAVQETLLAIPYAYGKLGAHRQSLDHYEHAIAVYNHEIARLDESIVAIRAGKLVEQLLKQDTDNEMGWFWRLETLPDSPESRYLVHLLASHDFQEALKNYRDLRFLARNLDAWEQNMGIYQDMVIARRQRYADRLPRIRQEQQGRSLAGYRAARDHFAHEVERIERSEDAKALATAQQQAWLVRLSRVAQGLKRMGDTPQAQEMRDKHRLLNGLLEFETSSAYAPRLWEVKRELGELDQALREADERHAALTRAYAAAPKSFEGYERRIDTLRGRVRILRTRVSDVAKAQEHHLAELAAHELQEQQQRLYTYITQARFAVAQIYDEAVRVQEEGKP